MTLISRTRENGPCLEVCRCSANGWSGESLLKSLASPHKQEVSDPFLKTVAGSHKRIPGRVGLCWCLKKKKACSEWILFDNINLILLQPVGTILKCNHSHLIYMISFLMKLHIVFVVSHRKLSKAGFYILEKEIY